MFREADDVKLSGQENFESNPELYDPAQIESIKNKLSLIHNGYVVHVTDCKSCDENKNFFTMKVVLYSAVNGMPVWGDVTLKITKQAAQKFRNSLHISKDVFIEDDIPPPSKKRY